MTTIMAAVEEGPAAPRPSDGLTGRVGVFHLSNTSAEVEMTPGQSSLSARAQRPALASMRDAAPAGHMNAPRERPTRNTVHPTSYACRRVNVSQTLRFRATTHDPDRDGAAQGSRRRARLTLRMLWMWLPHSKYVSE
ncbi:hypothetical protein BD626DRAFT_493918 [Schizophyllum amplum]|uniref:Uncharacterized protein n=1 Tax=Schizophyllum amplum TaxID=97359 RepID=A0A550CH53_9AGAR|nr:hypothetical protein BD626DRAFT_493918 [Auriculariopsis ampla]